MFQKILDIYHLPLAKVIQLVVVPVVVLRYIQRKELLVTVHTQEVSVVLPFVLLRY